MVRAFFLCWCWSYIYVYKWLFLRNVQIFVYKIFLGHIFDVGCFVFTWSYHFEDMNLESSFPASALVPHSSPPGGNNPPLSWFSCCQWTCSWYNLDPSSINVIGIFHFLSVSLEFHLQLLGWEGRSSQHRPLIKLLWVNFQTDLHRMWSLVSVLLSAVPADLQQLTSDWVFLGCGCSLWPHSTLD